MAHVLRWLCVLAVVAALPALAQQKPGKPRADEKSENKEAVEITADNGIEWDKVAGTYIARGNARVTRGDRTISADRITAWHRGEGKSKNDIYRVDAEGKVRVGNLDSVIAGDRMIYDNDNKVGRMTGRNLVASSPDYKMTARDSIEYWDDKRMAVARGNVVVIRTSEEMRADQMVAYFEPKDGNAPDPKKGGSSGKQRLARVEGHGNVYIATCQGFAHADKGLYDPNTGTAVLTGNVRLTRGREQMNGDTVEMNTRTGYTRLIAGAGGGRVTAMLEGNKDAQTPDNKPTDRPGAQPCPEKETASSPDAAPKK